MNAVLDALAIWVLLQLLTVCFGARVATVRQMREREYQELQDQLARSGLDVHARGSSEAPSAPPPIGVCSSGPVAPFGPLEETPARPLRASHGWAPRLN